LIPLEKTSFRATINLADRKIVLVDGNNGITKNYPLGVGGFDEGVGNNERQYRLMTPYFRNATLKRATVIFARSDPTYYQSMPFIRLIRGNFEWTPIGLHTNMVGDRLQNSNLENPAVFRGFNSHGCMRMRPKDLYELYFLVMYQGAT
ncbi:MAG: L,D-transpeptidase, partial [Bdellovibrionota bacterium]